MKPVLVALLSASFALAQSNKPTGAKALFFAAETGDETLASTSPQKQANKPRRNASAAVTTESKPAVTGLKYYIELREPDGSLQRVNPNRVFHSGERIRFHVSTNVDGDLVIYQEQDNEPEERLYPLTGMPGSTGRVTRNADVTLPSAHGWFVFDDHPGEIRLTLMVKAHLARADANDISGEANASMSAEEAHEIAGAANGSKALRIEDDSTTDQAEYKVIDNRLDPNIPAGTIATEVMLSHAR